MATAGDGRGAGPERAFCPSLPDTGEVVLAPEESRHLVRVRRVREGDAVVLFDGAGHTRLARLLRAHPQHAGLEIEGDYPDREPRRAVTLAVSPPEGGRSDALVATLAELGVARLVWIGCARTPPGRLDLPSRRSERWARLVREAAKVNGRSRLLEIGGPRAFVDALQVTDAAVLLDPDPRAPVVVDLLPDSGPLPWLFVGPEGGFTDQEIAAAAEAGIRRARLGAVALRTETAAIAAAAVALVA